VAKLQATLSIYDPSARTERAHKVTVEGPQLLIDCLDRDKSCEGESEGVQAKATSNLPSMT